MKKFLSLLLGSLIVLLVFVTQGNPVEAAKKAPAPVIEDCGCGVTPILGAERNKIVANLLKNNEFKKVKKQAKEEDYKMHGVNDIDVVKFDFNGSIGVAVPFYSKEGPTEWYAFIDGVFAGHAPR